MIAAWFRFIIVVIASHACGCFAKRFHIPAVSAFLILGALAGPYAGALLSSADLEALRPVDYLSLAFIAFASASEISSKELKEHAISVAHVAGLNVILVFSLSFVATFFLSPLFLSTSMLTRVSASALIGITSIARSVSSSVSTIQSLHSHGVFTSITLSVSIVVDLFVMAVFSLIAVSIGVFFEADIIKEFIPALILADLGAQGLLAGVLAGVLWLILSVDVSGYRRSHRQILTAIRSAIILAIGATVFWGSYAFREFTKRELGFTLYFEPISICALGSFLVSGRSYKGAVQLRRRLVQSLSLWALPLYCAFFTLAGASADLVLLSSVFWIVFVLFAVRFAAIICSSWIGSFWSGAVLPRHRLVMWMGFITQAGLVLALSRHVASVFPGWGGSLSTVITASILISQFVGPPLFRLGLTWSQEVDHPHEDPHQEAQALRLGRLAHGPWKELDLGELEQQVESIVRRDLEPFLEPSLADDAAIAAGLSVVQHAQATDEEVAAALGGATPSSILPPRIPSQTGPTPPPIKASDVLHPTPHRPLPRHIDEAKHASLRLDDYSALTAAAMMALSEFGEETPQTPRRELDPALEARGRDSDDEDAVEEPVVEDSFVDKIRRSLSMPSGMNAKLHPPADSANK